MYEIWADNLKIYDDTLDLLEYKVTDPVLTLEDNSSGCLKMTVPITNIGYNSITRMTTYISILRNGVEIWAGRVLSEEADFYNNRILTCEGEMAYFNDTAQPVAEYTNVTIATYLKALIAKHNQRVDSKRQFDIDDDQQITVTGTISQIYTNYDKTVDCLGKLIEQFGGHFRIRKVGNKRYLDYLANYVRVNPQKINFGENLMDFTRNWDESNFATVVIPLGAKLEQQLYEDIDERLTIRTVNDGKDYLESSVVSTYGRIERVVTWDDEESPQNLKTKGQQYLSELQFNNMALELSALDLHYLDANIEAINLLDVVLVTSPPHGMTDIELPVTKLEIPLDRPENTKFTLNGSAIATLSSLILSNKIQTEQNIKTTSQDTYKKSSVNTTKVVNKATNGYITITRETVQNPDGTDSLYITDTSNLSTALKMWKWDLTGLSYSTRNSSSASWGSPSVAMNMDGSIVADRITTGTLKSQNNNFSLALNDGTLTMKKGSINIGSNAFKVDTDGSVTITKGSLTIGSNDNFKVTSTGDVTIKNGNISLTQGSININDKFVVTSAGVVTITEGQINLGNNALTIDNQGNIFVTKGNLNLGNGAFQVNNNGSATITAGSINIGNGIFRVDSDGHAYFTAGAVDIGPWRVQEDGLLYSSGLDFWGGDKTLGLPGIIYFVSYKEPNTYKHGGTIRWTYQPDYTETYGDGLIGFRLEEAAGVYIQNADLFTPFIYVQNEYNFYDLTTFAYHLIPANSMYLDCNVYANDHTAYNLLLDPNTSGAVGGPSTTYAIGDSKLTVKKGFITGYSQYNYLNHRNILHGSSLGSTITAAQKKAIWNGSFSGMYVGDYWTINGVNWVIVDMDYWYGAGSGSAYNKHHLIIMPSKNMYVAKMNATNINNTGYAGSNMYSANLADARTAVNAAFPNLVLSHQDYLSNAVDANGIITASSVYTIDVDLPSELMVYGSNVMSNRYDPSVTVSKSRSQLAYFRLNPRYDNRGEYSWLKDPSGTTRFCVITTSGYIASYNASNSNPGVRPIFAMGPSSDPG